MLLSDPAGGRFILIVVILWEAFETFIFPRRVTRRLGLTRIFYRITWRAWRAVVHRILEARLEIFPEPVWAGFPDNAHRFVGLLLIIWLIQWGATTLKEGQRRPGHGIFISAEQLSSLSDWVMSVRLSPLARVADSSEAAL